MRRKNVAFQGCIWAPITEFIFDACESGSTRRSFKSFLMTFSISQSARLDCSIDLNLGKIIREHSKGLVGDIVSNKCRKGCDNSKEKCRF